MNTPRFAELDRVAAEQGGTPLRQASAGDFAQTLYACGSFWKHPIVREVRNPIVP